MCTYSRYSSMVQTRGVWCPLPVDELMLLTSGASAISCVFHIQHTSRTTKSDAGPAIRQPLFLSRQDGCICSDTLPVLVHLKTTCGLYEQLSVVCLWTGNACLVDQDEPGFERLSSTSSSTISASTCAGTFQVASTRGDGYDQSRTCHSMMMMMNSSLEVPANTGWPVQWL